MFIAVLQGHLLEAFQVVALAATVTHHESEIEKQDQFEGLYWMSGIHIILIEYPGEYWMLKYQIHVWVQYSNGHPYHVIRPTICIPDKQHILK